MASNTDVIMGKAGERANRVVIGARLMNVPVKMIFDVVIMTRIVGACR